MNCLTALGSLAALVILSSLERASGFKTLAYPSKLRPDQRCRLNKLSDVKGEFLRELGGYERLMARKAPGTNKVALSHGSVFLLNTAVANDILVSAMTKSIERHQILGSYIDITKDLKDVWMQRKDSAETLASEAIRTVKVAASEFEQFWKSELEQAINGPEFPANGPLWRLLNIEVEAAEGAGGGAWVFSVNHAVDDQSSLNIVVNELLTNIPILKSKQQGGGHTHTLLPVLPQLPFPPSIEDAVAPGPPGLRTLAWSIFQVLNSAAAAPVYPSHVAIKYKRDPEGNKAYADPDSRRTFCEFFDLSPSETARLLAVCRENNVTITQALAAAVLSLTAYAFQAPGEGGISTAASESTLLRFLLSVSLRPFGADADGADFSPGAVATSKGSTSAKSDFTEGTVACASGAVDFNIKVTAPLVDAAKGTMTNKQMTTAEREQFWELASACKEKASEIIDKWNFVPESVRLFGLGMTLVDILQAVEIEAKNANSLGRAYSCGVSNAGLVKFDNTRVKSAASTGDAGCEEEEALRVTGGYYATSHARSGVYALLSCMTISDKLCGCLQFTSPIASEVEARQYRDSLATLLKGL